MDARVAIQDQLPNNHCFGCGADNAAGMQLKSFWDGEQSVARYQPGPEQCAGPYQYVYGGTIASVIDCHCVGTSIAHYYARDDRPIGSDPEIWCVTGKLEVNYLKPTPIDQEIVLTARISACTERKTVIDCTATSRGVVTATANVIAIRVPDSWRADS